MPERVWGLLEHQKSLNRSEKMGIVLIAAFGYITDSASFRFFFKCDTLNVYQISPKFYRLFRACLSWVGAFWSIKKAQICPKIWVWMHWSPLIVIHQIRDYNTFVHIWAFWCSKRPQPCSGMSWTICEILVKFGTHLGCQIWKRCLRATSMY